MFARPQRFRAPGEHISGNRKERLAPMFAPRQIDQEDRLNSGQRTVVILMNIMLLAELTLCMYFGQKNPDNLTLFFLRTFPPAALLTLISSRMLIRRLAGPESDRADQ